MLVAYATLTVASGIIFVARIADKAPTTRLFQLWRSFVTKNVLSVFVGLLILSGIAHAEPVSFQIDAATLAAQVPPSKSGDPIPECLFQSALKLCAVEASVDDMADTAINIYGYGYDERFARLSREIKKNPGNTASQYMRAQMQIGGHKFAGALADLNQIIKVAPASPSALILRAQLYTIAAQYDLAIADIDAASYWVERIRGDKPSPLRMIGLTMRTDIFVRQGKMAEAQAALQKADLASLRDADGFQHRMLKTIRDRYELARTSFSADDLQKLSVAFELSYRNSMACEKPAIIERAIEKNLFAARALTYLASLPEKCQPNTISMGYADRAVVLAKENLKAASVTPEAQSDLINAYERRALIYERMGKMTEAVVDFHTAYQLYFSKDSAVVTKLAIDRVSANIPPEKLKALGINWVSDKTLTAERLSKLAAADAGSVEICNHTAHPVRLVVGYRGVGELMPATRGWHDLAAYGCTKYVAQAGTNFIYHAIDSVTYAVWKGNSQICVSTTLGDWKQSGYGQCDGSFEWRVAETVPITKGTERRENLR